MRRAIGFERESVNEHVTLMIENAVRGAIVDKDWKWPTMFIMDLLHLFIGVPE